MTRDLLPDSAFDKNLNIRVIRLASKLTLLLARKTFRPIGISGPEVRVLIYLMRFGDLHLRLLARKTSLDPSRLSKVMRLMERNGLIERRKDDEDRRLVLFSITPKGEEMFDRVWPETQAAAENVHALYDEDEFEVVKQGIERADAYVQGLLDQMKPMDAD